MTNSTRLLFSLLLVTLSLELYAQQPIKDCDDIEVEVSSTDPTPGGSNGSIELSFKDPIQNYKIFWLNAGNSGMDKVEIKDGKLKNLKAGFFDLLVVDNTRKMCIRQLTVTLK